LPARRRRSRAGLLEPHNPKPRALPVNTYTVRS